MVIWFTGLSGSGKSTLAEDLSDRLLLEDNIKSIIIDGDMLRNGICSDLGYDENSRKENVRRAAEICKILSEYDILVIATLMSPTNEMRNIAKNILGDNMKLVYISTPIDECIKRDPKHIYQKYNNGLIKNISGIDAIFEKPSFCDIEIDTTNKSIYDCTNKIIQTLFN